jgi:ABC-2 type transport system permease protein
MRPVFKYGVAFCVGLFFGFLMDQMFGLGELGMLIAIVIWGIVGYFVAQMLLDKSIRVFKKWKGAVAVTAAFLLLFAVIGFDLTGYETRVPSVSNVASAEITGLYGGPGHDTGANLGSVQLTDPADIEAVVNLHQGIVDQGEKGERGYYYDVDGVYLNQYMSFRVTYTLKSGGTLSRRYNVVMGDDLLAKAQVLRDRYNVRYQAYQLDDIAEWEEVGYKRNEVEFYHEYSSGHTQDLSANVAPYVDELWAAVMEDFEAGRIGVHEIGGDEKSANFSYDRLSFQWALRVSDGARYRHIEFVVLPQSSSTWAALEGKIYKATDNTYQDNPNDNPLWREG